jgi:hypothetical protein
MNQRKNAARGGIERAVLESLIESGASQREIAEHLDLSIGTVRHWLARYGLQTRPAAARELRKAMENGSGNVPTADMPCYRHGLTQFRLEGRGIYRCLKCRSENVARRRRRVKAILVDEASGRCRLCGYDRCIGALHFHHVDPEEKLFSLSGRGLTRSLEDTRAEARKCALLCSNCHAEVEAGIASL